MSYLESLHKLDKKVVAIYGGGGHICSKLAEGFLKAGSYVVLLDIRNKNLINVKKKLEEKKLNNFKILRVDTTKKNDHIKGKILPWQHLPQRNSQRQNSRQGLDGHCLRTGAFPP